MFDKHSWTTWVLIIVASTIIAAFLVVSLKDVFNIPLGSLRLFRRLLIDTIS